MESANDNLRTDYGSLSYIRECLRYEAETGLLFWRADRPLNHFKLARSRNRWLGIHADKPITCVAKNGYVVFNLQGKMHYAHRVIFAMLNGLEMIDLPKQVDHKDTNRTNNREGNLRAATPSLNNQNRSLSANTYSGMKGASLVSGGGNWRSSIQLNGKSVHLGVFKTADEAHAAYVAAANDNFGEFARAA